MNHWGGIHIGGLVAILGNLLCLAAVVVGVVLLVRAFSRPSPSAPPPPASPSAQQILAERFARGEIDAEEYQARLRVLNEQPPPQTGSG